MSVRARIARIPSHGSTDSPFEIANPVARALVRRDQEQVPVVIEADEIVLN
jgi:hypothetical protein